MRRKHAVALAAVILVGIGVKLFFFAAAPPAEAEARPSLDISRTHIDKKLPVQMIVAVMAAKPIYLIWHGNHLGAAIIGIPSLLVAAVLLGCMSFLATK